MMAGMKQVALTSCNSFLSLGYVFCSLVYKSGGTIVGDEGDDRESTDLATFSRREGVRNIAVVMSGSFPLGIDIAVEATSSERKLIVRGTRQD